MTPITEVTPGFALTLGLIALYWWVRVVRSARERMLPRVGWWAVPGLVLLLVTPLVDVPALFGVGLALLLLAEYWPGAYRYSQTRPGTAWPWVGVAVGAALWWSLIRTGQEQPGVAVTGLALLLAGMGGLLSSAFYPRAGQKPALGFQTRWNNTVTPDWPDLSVTLTASGAHLKNVSQQVLQVAGWSPARVNAWLPIRDAQGRLVSELRAGQEALLPVSELDSGVRVWYGKATVPGQPHLFKADWTPPARADQRVLN